MNKEEFEGQTEYAILQQTIQTPNGSVLIYFKPKELGLQIPKEFNFSEWIYNQNETN